MFVLVQSVNIKKLIGTLLHVATLFVLSVELPCREQTVIIQLNMPRPRIRRRLRFQAKAHYFKPAGIPMRELEEVVLAKDEIEALKLYNFDQKDQKSAANEMAISQPTFARTINQTYQKIAEALISGKAIRIEE
jgi:predicted DNA-binding protein (UPF0251 family)